MKATIDNLDQAILEEISNQELTPEIAKQLTIDARRSDELVNKIALRVAAATPGTIDVTELLGLVREKLSIVISEAIEYNKDRKYRTVDGVERIGNGENSIVDFGVGYSWRVGLYNDHIVTSLSHSNIAAANLLSGLSISPDDLRKLIGALLPRVVKEDGEFVLKKANPNGVLENLYMGDRQKGSGYSLSEIVTQRETKWGSYPVYSKEDLALYLEAVIHSDMPQEEKNSFIDKLLKTQDFDEDIWYSRPPYAGGDYKRHESGTRIFLPTGQSMRVVQDGRLMLDSPRQSYLSERSDVVFVMALVERGRLPMKALDSIYKVSIHGGIIHLWNTHMLNQNVSIDLSKPFDKKIDFLPLYLSFLLTRDPRISIEDRRRIRQYFGNNIDVKIVPPKD